MCNHLNNYDNLNGWSLHSVYIFMKHVHKKMYSYGFKTDPYPNILIPLANWTSVFTSEDPLQPLPDLGPSPHPVVSDITITWEGIQKLLCHLNPHKATGPDQVSPRLLKETAKQI